MKFFVKIKKIEIYNIIFNNKITAILNSKDSNAIYFFTNSKQHNYKNAAYTDKYGYKEFCLNGKACGSQKHFTKESWRRYVKLKAFL